MTAEPGPAPPGRPALLGGLLLAAALAYAFAIHHGIGPAPSASPEWYQPRGFLLRWSWLGWVFESSRRVLVVGTLPAAGLAAAVFLTTRSALARALALSSVFATLLFLFYGEVAVQVWEFFHWRGSAVLALTALVVGFAAAAPLLAASWLRLGWALRLLVYVPICLGVIAFIRNATGTDPSLRFSISPWPAVPVFGIEVGALFVELWLIGVALGVAGIARARRGRSPALWASLGVASGLALPPALLALGSRLHLFPFTAGTGTLAGVAAACAVGIPLAALAGTRGRAGALRRRALHLGLGAALIGIPMLVGQAWARWDYSVTREQRARQIIDALERYYERQEIYPDELEELVSEGLLEEIPEPDIGFGFLYDGSFRYRSFGTSYILEFPAPRWVECAYTPPYLEEEEEEAEDLAEGEALGESWSCPSRPPELW